MAARIASHIEFFDEVVAMIPVWYYYPQLEDADEEPRGNTRHKAKQSKEAKKSKVKKQYTAEPTSVLTVQKQKRNEQKLKRDGEAVAPQPAAGGVGAASSMSELRQRLQEKLNMLKTGRETVKEHVPERKGRKRKKAQSSEKDAKRAKPAKEEKAKTKKTKTAIAAAKPAPKAESTGEQASEGSADFLFSSVKESVDVTKMRKKGLSNRAAMAKVQSFDAKVREVQMVDPTRASEMVHDKSMSSALLRAQGVKVKDDKTRIKKAMKKKLSSKKKSQKEWKERVQVVRKDMNKRIDARADNINNRLKERKENRVKQSIKKRGDARLFS